MGGRYEKDKLKVVTPLWGLVGVTTDIASMVQQTPRQLTLREMEGWQAVS